jgi:hypothetical protein
MRGAVDIASSTGAEDLGSNPTRVYVRFFRENMAMLFCSFDIVVC